MPGFSDSERRNTTTTGPSRIRKDRAEPRVPRARRLAALCTGWPGRVHYDAVCLDVDGGTSLGVNPDVQGHVGSPSPHTVAEGLTAERAGGPVWGSLRRHSRENTEHQTGNDPASHVQGASEAGVGAERVDRNGAKAPEATLAIPDLSELPGLVRS